jgi:hypothetical protein
MKWLLLSAVLFALPTFAADKKGGTLPTCDTKCAAKCWAPEAQGACEPDLFKQNVQVFSGSAEFLYWTVAEGNLDYALKMSQDAWGPSPSYAQGNYQNASYNIDPGFRLKLSYFRAPHFWEVMWQYTRMTNRGDSSSDKPDADLQYLTGTWPQIIPAPLSGAHSHIHLNYNVFDWLIDRVFIPNPHLRLKLVGGAFAAWMDQDWKIRYNDAIDRTTTIRNKWHYVGAGLKSGTIIDWYWTGDLYMTAQGFFGLLLGNYSNHSRQSTTYQPDPSDNTSVPIRDAIYKDTRPVMTGQMIFGPSYQKNFCKTRLEIFAGFEVNAWFNVQEIYRSTSGSASEAKETWINSSLLALYGLTTRMTLDY